MAAVLLVGYGSSVPDISIHKATIEGNIKVVKQHLVARMDVNLSCEKAIALVHATSNGVHRNCQTTNCQRCERECKGCWRQNTSRQCRVVQAT